MTFATGTLDWNSSGSSGAPAQASYENTADSLATMEAAGYFNAGFDKFRGARVKTLRLHASDGLADYGVTLDTTERTVTIAPLAAGDLAYLTTSATTARTNKQRWSDTVHVMDHAADPTGGTASFHTVLANAISEAQARSRSEIRLPPTSGRLKLGGTVTIINPESVPKQIRIIGAGTATRVSKNGGTGTWFQVGPTGNTIADKTRDVIFEDFTIEASDAMTANSVFNWRNVRDCQLRNVPMTGIRQAHLIGRGATAINDCLYMDFIDSPINIAATSDVATILLGSGAVLNIKGGGRFNSATATAGRSFIEHDHATLNWDGLYVYDQFFEQWWHYLWSHGCGIVNVTWKGGQADRTDAIQFLVDGESGNGSRNWKILGVDILNAHTGAGGETRPIFWNPSLGAGNGLIQFANNTCEGFTHSAFFGAGTFAVVGNTFVACGRGTGAGGGAVVRIGEGAKGSVNSNVSNVYSGVTANTHGIEWDGASDSDRKSADNNWIGRSAADETGTP